MDYEKLYKDALERAREMSALPDDRATIEYIFPELAESEDERIRKHLISLVKNWDKDGIFSKYTSNPNDIKKILAWLEKQVEQKSGWDEDDERLRKTSIAFLQEFAAKGYENAIECMDWLKSLKNKIKNE